MAPKHKAVLGDSTPDHEEFSGDGEKKKKDDDAATPSEVDKDAVSGDDKKKKDAAGSDDDKKKKKDPPGSSEDEKKKKDSSSTQKKGSSSKDQSSHDTQLTELTDVSSGDRAVQGKMKNKMVLGKGRRPSQADKAAGMRKKETKRNRVFNSKMKDLRKRQKIKEKHPRSLQGNISRVLRSVNESQEQDGIPGKRVNPLAMMIFDSFANDLSDRLIGTAVELTKNNNRRQVGSAEIKTAIKLVLPPDMVTCAEETVNLALTKYKESTHKYAGKIGQTRLEKKKAAGLKTKKDEKK